MTNAKRRSKRTGPVMTFHPDFSRHSLRTAIAAGVSGMVSANLLVWRDVRVVMATPLVTRPRRFKTHCLGVEAVRVIGVAMGVSTARVANAYYRATLPDYFRLRSGLPCRRHDATGRLFKKQAPGSGLGRGRRADPVVCGRRRASSIGTTPLLCELSHLSAGGGRCRRVLPGKDRSCRGEGARLQTRMPTTFNRRIPFLRATGARDPSGTPVAAGVPLFLGQSSAACRAWSFPASVSIQASTSDS